MAVGVAAVGDVVARGNNCALGYGLHTADHEGNEFSPDSYLVDESVQPPFKTFDRLCVGKPLLSFFWVQFTQYLIRELTFASFLLERDCI